MVCPAREMRKASSASQDQAIALLCVDAWANRHSDRVRTGREKPYVCIGILERE